MKIVFAGYGIEAESAYRFYKQEYPDAQFAVYESREAPKNPLPEGVEFKGGVADFKDIEADLVVRTPSISPDYISTTGRVTSVTREFLARSQRPVIGVTGTKGKGTTASLIALMLRKAGIKTWLVGNIGVGALDVLHEVNSSDKGVVIYEMSSFQLWDLQQSPHVAVVLTIEPEHLDVHGSFENYLDAKANIARYQHVEDTVVYFGDNDFSSHIASLSAGKKQPYTGSEAEYVIYDGEPLVAISELGLRGAHNLQNINAALAAASEFTQDRSALAAALREFKGLPHRIEEVGMRDGVLYVNDSFSSAPPATLAAVRAYSQPIALIMGGYDRGIDLEPLVEQLVAERQVVRVVLIGQTAPKLQSLFDAKDFRKVTIADTLEGAFDDARSAVIQGGVVLMSPGCASFDMFKDFTDRGEQFRALVRTLPRTFVFDRYEFNRETLEAAFYYNFDNFDTFVERVVFDEIADYDDDALQRALSLAFLVIGTSYCKIYPGARIHFNSLQIDEWQAKFLNSVYQEGMSQYAFENGLTRADLAHFESTGSSSEHAGLYAGTGTLSLQSGGKDSLLSAQLLAKAGIAYDSLYVASRDKHYPKFLDNLPGKLHIAERLIDLNSLKKHADSGGLSGHIPVTYVVLSVALIQAVLLNKKTVVASIGHEGEEPHDWIGDLPVTHQWSKTWFAEQLFADYVQRYISPDLQVGSPLRKYTELRIAELFSEHAWHDFGRLFSSCNVANYKQGSDNTTLSWCGNCPKCANSFLLFAAFLPQDELKPLFDGQDLFTKPSLEHVFKGLLGIDGVMKPFECIGEVDELRLAYGMAMERGYSAVPFAVPSSVFDYKQEYPTQQWAAELF